MPGVGPELFNRWRELLAKRGPEGASEAEASVQLTSVWRQWIFPFNDN